MLNFPKNPPSATPEEVMQKIGDGRSALLVDVRERDEYENGHARGAKNIPLGAVPDHVEELRAYSNVYLICATGGRSARATQRLLSEQVNAINVLGGTVAWRQAGLPVE